MTEKYWNIWLIDDQIPITSLGSKGIYTVERALPIHSDLLQLAVNLDTNQWSEPRVLEVVRELIEQVEVSVTAFQDPETAITYLKKGAVHPDLIIYDWEYLLPKKNDDHLKFLDELLGSGFSFIHIYSHADTQRINDCVNLLKEKYAPQLLGVTSKHEKSPMELLDQAKKIIGGTIAGDFASHLRQVSEEALGRSLRHFSRLSIKDVCNSLEETEEIVNALANGVERDLISSELKTKATQNNRLIGSIKVILAKLISWGIRDNSSIQQVIKAHEETASASDTSDINTQAIRGFQAYQLYVNQSTDYVLRGDIVDFEGSLGMILTSPCDLYRFSSKTRNVLTYVVIEKCNEQGWLTLTKSYGKSVNKNKGNIDIKASISDRSKFGSEGPFILPSVPMDYNENYQDMFLLPHKIQFVEIDAPVCELKATEPLCYSHLQKQIPNIRRITSLSEPYLSPLMWAIAQSLFSPGAENFIQTEVDRLKSFAYGNFQNN